MKVCASIPIGNLELFGYHRFWKTTLEIQSRNFDKVYLVSTSRSNKNLKIALNNVELIYNEELLFDVNNNGEEIINIYKIYEAEDYAMSIAEKENFDFAIRLPINSYYPYENFSNLKDYLSKLKENNVPVGYNHKAIQFGDKLFYPNTSLPTIINLSLLNLIKFDIDVTIVKNKRMPYKPIHGITSDRYFIDIFGAENIEELDSKFNTYVKGYLKDWKRVESSFNKEDIANSLTQKIVKLKLNSKNKIGLLSDVYNQCYNNDSVYHSLKKESLSNQMPYIFYMIMQKLKRYTSLIIGNK